MADELDAWFRTRGALIAKGAPLDPETLYRISSPHFVAGLVLDVHGRCTYAAPILKWAIGKDVRQLRLYFTNKRYRMELVDESKA